MAKPTFDTSQVQFTQLAKQCPIVPGAVVSKPLINTSAVKQILFSMDRGQEISEHRAPFVATVHVLEGRLKFTAGGNTEEMVADDWCVLPANEPHSLIAEQATRFMLIMAKEDVS